MFTKTITIISLAAAFAAAPVMSQDRVDNRQDNQRERIENGIKDGSLTRQEAKKLIMEQKRIAALEGKLQADGELNKKDKARLEKRQDKASVRIAKDKHDGQTRNTSKMRKTDRNQKRRIIQGVKSGELTKNEARTLVRDQKRIHKVEKMAMKDGEVTLQEKKRIAKMKEKESKRIYRKKHNEQTREK